MCVCLRSHISRQTAFCSRAVCTWAQFDKLFLRQRICAYNNAAFICMAAEKLKENTARACKRVGKQRRRGLILDDAAAYLMNRRLISRLGFGFQKKTRATQSGHYLTCACERCCPEICILYQRPPFSWEWCPWFQADVRNSKLEMNHYLATIRFDKRLPLTMELVQMCRPHQQNFL
jgi:hypothetical protein